MKYKILDIVDMQNSFIHEKGILSIAGATCLVEKTNSFFRNIPKGFFDAILVKQDTHFKEEYLYSEESESFPLHCEYKSWDWGLAINLSLIKEKSKVYKMYKNVFDMWATSKMKIFAEVNEIDYKLLFKIFSSEECIARDTFFNRYNSLNTEVYMFGVASDYCVKYALEGYLARGYQVNIIADLTKGIVLSIQEILNKNYKQHLNKKVKLIHSTDIFNTK